MAQERDTSEEAVVEEHDYYVDKPNDLRRLSDMQDWEVAEGEPDVRGWAVVNGNGDRIGTIEDLMVSLEYGAAVMMLISYGGHWGMSETRTLVPIDWFELDLGNDRATFLGSDDDLKDAPKFSDDVRDFGPYYDYWAEREPEWEEEEVEVAVGDIEGWSVYDQHGHEIGQIDGFVTDENDVLAVVGYGRFWSMPTKQTLVPLDRLMVDEENQRVILDMTADHLKAAPEYTGATQDFGPYYEYWGGRSRAA